MKGRNSSPVPTLVLKQSVLLLLALHLPLDKMEVFAPKHLLRTQELVARQFIFSSWSKGRQLCVTCRVNLSLEGSLHSPVVREYVYTRVCFDSGCRRAQQFLTPRQSWLYSYRNGQRVSSWYAGGDTRVQVGERKMERLFKPWSRQTAWPGRHLKDLVRGSRTRIGRQPTATSRKQPAQYLEACC